MTTQVVLATPHVVGGKRIRVEVYDPSLPEDQRTYRVVHDMGAPAFVFDYGPCLHGTQAIRLTEVDAEPSTAVAVLEAARDNARTNEPIHRTEGNVEQADACARQIVDLNAALDRLR